MGWDLDRARQEVSQSSAGGAPFLICFGTSLLICAIASFYLPAKQAALAVMFQGGSRCRGVHSRATDGLGAMAKENPLNTLSVQLAMSQIVAFPIVIAMYGLRPGAVPLAMAAIAGGHFLPYAWLQRTNVYVWLASRCPRARGASDGAWCPRVSVRAHAHDAVLLAWCSACVPSAES
jgi:hypothetical protein